MKEVEIIVRGPTNSGRSTLALSIEKFLQLADLDVTRVDEVLTPEVQEKKRLVNLYGKVKVTIRTALVRPLEPSQVEE